MEESPRSALGASGRSSFGLRDGRRDVRRLADVPVTEAEIREREYALLHAAAVLYGDEWDITNESRLKNAVELAMRLLDEIDARLKKG